MSNDHLGTPQKLTESNGNVVWSAGYKSFGEANIDEASTVVNNLRFPGQYYDQETGLHYNYYRYYDPGVGRYDREDPVGLVGGVNLFAYVDNNPINLYDYLGFFGGHPGGYLCMDYPLQILKNIRQIDKTEQIMKTRKISK